MKIQLPCRVNKLLANLLSRMVYFTLVLILQFGQTIAGINCYDVQSKGSGSAFKAEELRTLSNLNADDLKECVILLGKEMLSVEQSKAIWTALISVFGSANDIPEETLQHLGWITNGIEPDHFYNLTLTEVDTIASLGRCTDLSKAQLNALHSAIFEQWNSKEVEDLSSYDLMVLRQVLCAFNGSEILKIHADAYKDAALELATLKNCTKEVFEGLATLATSPQAFGNPQSWTSLQVATVGCIVAGLPSIKVIQPEAMEGFTKDTITCLEPHALKELSEDHILNLSPSAAGALTPSQLSALYKSQKYAVEMAIKGLTDSEKSSATFLKSFPIMYYCLLTLGKYLGSIISLLPK